MKSKAKATNEQPDHKPAPVVEMDEATRQNLILFGRLIVDTGIMERFMASDAGLTRYPNGLPKQYRGYGDTSINSAQVTTKRTVIGGTKFCQEKENPALESDRAR